MGEARPDNRPSPVERREPRSFALSPLRALPTAVSPVRRMWGLPSRRSRWRPRWSSPCAVERLSLRAAGSSPWGRAYVVERSAVERLRPRSASGPSAIALARAAYDCLARPASFQPGRLAKPVTPETRPGAKLSRQPSALRSDASILGRAISPKPQAASPVEPMRSSGPWSFALSPLRALPTAVSRRRAHSVKPSRRTRPDNRPSRSSVNRRRRATQRTAYGRRASAGHVGTVRFEQRRWRASLSHLVVSPAARCG